MKQIVLMMAFILIIGAASIYYINQKDSITNSIPSASEQVFNEENSRPSSQNKLAIKPYQEFSKPGFDGTSDKIRVLFFYADWCPTCRPADADFKANLTKIPDNVIVFRVNYRDTQTDDEEERLAAQYGITYQHTYVQVNSEGKEVAKWNGGALDKLISEVQ